MLVTKKLTSEYIISFVILMIFAFIGYDVLTTMQNMVVVDDKGEIKGKLNTIREALNGREFWVKQLTIVNEVLERKYNEPKRKNQHDKEMGELDLKIQEMEETVAKEIYKDDTAGYRAHKIEKQAEKLLVEADKIRYEKEIRKMNTEDEERRMQRIDELLKIKEVIKMKLGMLYR